VLALVSLVAVTAVGVTASLTYIQTSRQVTESATTDRNTILRVADELRGYARRHGTWEGVVDTVQALHGATADELGEDIDIAGLGVERALDGGSEEVEAADTERPAQRFDLRQPAPDQLVHGNLPTRDPAGTRPRWTQHGRCAVLEARPVPTLVTT
jgi:hypothetical protein